MYASNEQQAETIAYYTRVYNGPEHSHQTATTLAITQYDLARHDVHTPAELVARWNEQDPTRWTYYLEN